MQFVVIGACGWAGRHHLTAIQSLGHKVLAVVDPSPDRKVLADQVGAKAFASVEDADLSGCTAASIALRPDYQPDVVRRMAAAGLHVFCEKPMAPSVEEAERLSDMARTSNVIIYPGYLLRVHAQITEFKRELHKSGKIRRLTCTSNIFKPTVEGWRTKVGSGGVALVNGVHIFDVASWLTEAKLSPIGAETANVHFNMETEDYIRASLRGPAGETVTVVTSWSPHPPVSPDGVFVDQGWQVRIEAETVSRSLVLTRNGYRVDDREVALDGSATRDPFELEFDNFIAVIEGRACPLATVQDNLNAQRLVNESVHLAAGRQAYGR